MPKATRAEVYAALDSERDYQDMRTVRDGSTTARPHSAEEFLVYTQDYLNEALHVASRVWGPEANAKIMEIVRKVSALCVANMEGNGAPQRAGFERVVAPSVTYPMTQAVAGEVLTLNELDHSYELGANV